MRFIWLLISVFAFVFATVQAVDKAACLQPKEIGPCRKADVQFYYDSGTKSCEQFVYGGCHGNDNRFNTKEECDKLCL